MPKMFYKKKLQYYNFFSKDNILLQTVLWFCKFFFSLSDFAKVDVLQQNVKY